MFSNSCSIVLSVAAAMGISVAVGQSTTQPGRLSARETLDLAFFRPHQGTPWELYRVASPDVADALRRVLDDTILEDYHPACWRMLGVIGSPDDVRRIEDTVKKGFPHILTRAERESVRAMFEALGFLCQRDVNGARQLMRVMLAVDYWRGIKLRWRENDHVGQLVAPYETIACLAEGYGLAGNDGMQAQIAAIVDAIPNEQTKTYMQWRMGAQRLSELPAITVAPQGTAAQWLALAKGKSNGDLLNPRPVDGVIRPSTAPATVDAGVSPRDGRPKPPGLVAVADASRVASEKKVIEEALSEYERLKLAVSQGEVDAVLPRLLANGRPLTAEQVKRASYRSDLALERQILEMPAMRSSKPSRFLIEQQRSVYFARPASEGLDAEVYESEVTSVSFVLDGTREVGQSPLLRNNIGTLTVAPDGSLIVVMKKIQGKWFWNPFAW